MNALCAAQRITDTVKNHFRIQLIFIEAMGSLPNQAC
ncbi:MAG: hypothetical protein K0S45_3639 [Nitrospira sp.]|jgi:hypothetical protein|nr:hypothetical protein [Nitrospira sp.]MCE3222511.1 hypothetical protein [Nitrospira sp.]